ncbi:ABC transporter ATPase [Olivibacter sp. XZL3]|uniref:ABC transporter ATPase n=1 Tax=Olivibacter sp. XZL3 TaxID=1735116 RepID=UPI001065365E|nr:ABC transporter ATPase [Olivibacter sp. XZL3]
MERIWIYQGAKPFSDEEEAFILEKLAAFTSQWKAHKEQLAAKVEIRYHLFIIISVDQSVALPSGCSIDKSVHILKELEQTLNISLFDRMQIAYRQGDEIRVVPRASFERLLAEGQINEDTLVFNNMVDNRNDLITKWEVPFKDSWHARVFA